MSGIIHIEDENGFNQVISGAKPALVDFWAPWCGPCKMIAPILEEVSAEISDRVTVAKVNVDDNSEIASTHGIRGIPTLVLFKDGQVVDRLVGLQQKAQLIKWVEERI